jgi:hypothetical protein
MENKFILVEQDGNNQITNTKGPYTYMEAYAILENGQKELGGDLYVPGGNHEWAFEWHYNDSCGTYWSILPIDGNFVYPENIES